MVLHIKVKPGSRIDQLTVETDGTIKVKVKCPPVDGKANKYLIQFLSEFFEIPKSYIQLLKGEASQHKTILINADEEMIRKKLSDQ